MNKEHERVILTNDLAAEGLKAGDVGTVIHIHQGGETLKWSFSHSTVRLLPLLLCPLHMFAR